MNVYALVGLATAEAERGASTPMAPHRMSRYMMVGTSTENT